MSTAHGVTTIPCGAVNFAILRVLDATGAARPDHPLTARWAGQMAPALVASSATGHDASCLE